MRKIVKLLLFVGAFIVLAQVSLKPASAQEYHAELATEEKQGDNILVTICVSSTSPENLLAIDHIVLTCRAAEYSKDLPGFPTLVDKCHDDSLDKVLGEAKTWQDPVTVTTNIIASVPDDPSKYFTCFSFIPPDPRITSMDVRGYDSQNTQLFSIKKMPVEQGEYNTNLWEYLKKTICSRDPTGLIYCGELEKPSNLCADQKSISTAIGCIPITESADFFAFLLRWAIGIGGGIAFLLLVYAGFIIMTSTGNPERLKAGQQLLTSAISGLILLIFAVFLLRLIGVTILKIPGF